MHASDGQWNDINGGWRGPAVYKTGAGAPPSNVFGQAIAWVGGVANQAMDRGRGFNQPPNPSGQPHPEHGNFFWQCAAGASNALFQNPRPRLNPHPLSPRAPSEPASPEPARPVSAHRRYYTQEECGPHKHGGCCYAAVAPACLHGEIGRWTEGQDKTCEWLLCPYCIPCMIENDRKAIERKIHGFHRDRGDPRASNAPFGHEGVACCAMMSPLLAWIIHAQNNEVMKEFIQTQAGYI